MNTDKLKDVLEQHLKWVNGDGGKRANLSGADLSGADLSDANLSDANLSDANLSVANLSVANLSVANLSVANLSVANLSGANLRCANLSGADLSGAKIDQILADKLNIIPDGDVIGWKKCMKGVIVKMEISANTPRSNATGRKCRAASVKVLEVIGADKGISQYDTSVVYRVGETVSVSNFDTDRWNECSAGIHFFLTKDEAENY
jgi:hypothetical protein